MKKIWVIIKREYLIRVRTKAFIIGTIISPLLMLALILLPAFLATRGGGARHVSVIDQSNDPTLFEAIKQRAEATATTDNTGGSGRARFANTRYELSKITIQPGENVEDVKARLSNEVKEDSDEAYVVLPGGVLDNAEPEYYTKNPSDPAIRGIEQAISTAVIERRLTRAGINPTEISRYMKSVDMRKIKVGPEGESEDSGVPTFIIAFIMLFFLYMTILFYGIFVMRGVIEEKQSRIVEVIVSSVKPFQMMIGKIIGIGLVGLTQYAIWILSGVLLSFVGAKIFASTGADLPKVPASLLIYFIVYFLLGYFLFATLYAMVGAMVSSEEDAQQVQFPVTMLIIIPMVVFTLVMNNPNSPTSVTLSMIPFFAPTLMMLRIAVDPPPWWQIALSMLLMVVTIFGAIWVAARIYRVGILMYGKRPSLAELGRWLRYS
ncbi:MAG TPA: ABC transporter permease [Blastocatellia bacterium]|nr:ABC transporter permease [Blastocatellia bacterium]